MTVVGPVTVGWKVPCAWTPVRPAVPSSTMKCPEPVAPVPVELPVITAVPDIPLTVPVNIPVSCASNVPSAWTISTPLAILVPVRKPESVCVSMAVMIVLPSACRMLVTVTVAVKLPVADAGVDALAMGMRKIRDSSRGDRDFRVLQTRVG